MCEYVCVCEGVKLIHWCSTGDREDVTGTLIFKLWKKPETEEKYSRVRRKGNVKGRGFVSEMLNQEGGTRSNGRRYV